jgi:hypothetical protein
MQYHRIQAFSGVHLLEDGPEAPKNSLAACENLIPRPKGALQRMPVYQRFWNQRDMLTELTSRGLTSADNGVLVEIANEQQTITTRALVGFHMATGKALGIFFIGDTNGNVNMTTGFGDNLTTAGTMTYTVLRTGLAAKRLYFNRIYREVWIGNGADPNMIYSQTRSPKLRLAGTSLAPDKPLVSKVPTAAAAPAVQAKRDFVLADATLTLTANDVSFIGTQGHYIQVAIANSGSAAAITSTRTGAGTVGSPFIYTITIGNTVGNSSGDAIKAFVDADYNAQGVLVASLSGAAPLANAAFTASVAALSGGIDEIVSAPFPSGFRCRVACALYDPGVSGEALAYEGPVGALSPELFSLGTQDMLVTVAAKTSEARFTQQSIWLREYASTAYPVNPDGPFRWHRVAIVPNANGTYRIRGNFEPLQTQEATPAEGRVPPCTMFEFAGNRMWASGNAAQPDRIWLSKGATEAERTPEGCDITSFLDVEGRKEEPSRPRVTALRKLEERVQAHTDRSVTLFDANSLRRIVSRSDFGALNPSCLAAWNRPEIPYLGADGVLYTLNNTQYYRSAEATPTAWPLLRSSVNVPALVADPSLAHVLADATNQLVLIFAPTLGTVASFNSGYGNTAIPGCFVVDMETGGMAGPNTVPRFYSSSPTNAADNRHIGITEFGDMLMLDLNNLHSEFFPISGPFTVRAPGYSASPAGFGGGFNRVQFAVPLFSANTGYSYDKSAVGVMQTHWLDLGEPNIRKGFYSLEWSTARYSRALVNVFVESDGGASQFIQYGDVYGRERHKVAFLLSGNAIRVRLTIVVAEDRPFILRDLTIGYERQANEGGMLF